MASPQPTVGSWYRLEGGETFEIVAIDDDEGTIEVQYFDGTVEDGGIRVRGATLHPPEGQLRAVKGHGKLTVGIRPEHLSIGGDGELTLEVALVEDLGSDSYIYGHLAGDADSHVIVRATRDHPRRGETVKVKVDTTHLHLFDAGTGRRLGE